MIPYCAVRALMANQCSEWQMIRSQSPSFSCCVCFRWCLCACLTRLTSPRATGVCCCLCLSASAFCTWAQSVNWRNLDDIPKVVSRKERKYLGHMKSECSVVMVFLAAGKTLLHQRAGESLSSFFDSTQIGQSLWDKTDKTSRHCKHFPNRLKYSEAASWLIGAFRVLWFTARRLRLPYSHSAAFAEGNLSWWEGKHVHYGAYLQHTSKVLQLLTVGHICRQTN